MKLKTKILERCQHKCINTNRCLFVDYDFVNKVCYINTVDMEFPETEKVISESFDHYRMIQC